MIFFQTLNPVGNQSENKTNTTETYFYSSYLSSEVSSGCQMFELEQTIPSGRPTQTRVVVDHLKYKEKIF